MKKIVFYLSCCSMILLTSSCEQDAMQDLGIRPDETPSGTFQSEDATSRRLAAFSEGVLTTVEVYCPSLEGNLLGDPALRPVNVYLPKSYYVWPEKRFPVIYFLHGIPATENALIDQVPFEIFRQVAMLQAGVDFPEEGFLNWVNDLIDQGGMQEAIIVMPNAATKYAISCYTNSSIQGNYEDYIVTDLVSYIDDHFRTIPNFNFRAITGHCIGAYGAMKIAMKHPQVFRYTAGLSPGIITPELMMGVAIYSAMEDQMVPPPGPSPFDPYAPFKFFNNGAYSFAAAWLPNSDNPPYYVDLPYGYDENGPFLIEQQMARLNEHSLFTLIEENRKGLEKLKFIYFDCGTNDDLMMYEPNMALHETLVNMNIPHEFETYEGTHISHLYERLENVFIALSECFPGEKLSQ